jgi:hypothetical protein
MKHINKQKKLYKKKNCFYLIDFGIIILKNKKKEAKYSYKSFLMFFNQFINEDIRDFCCCCCYFAFINKKKTKLKYKRKAKSSFFCQYLNE